MSYKDMRPFYYLLKAAIHECDPTILHRDMFTTPDRDWTIEDLLDYILNYVEDYLDD
jgi:hypothetical protein